ncbi:MAG: ABC transporter ATP-binding protein [Telluria sp.]
MMDSLAMRFAGVGKRYRSQAVLHDVDLDIGAGACVAIAGVNGAGKTTLLRCLFDFVALDHGSIAVFGRDHRDPRARAPLAFLPERFVPPYYMTGTEFARHLLGLHGQALDAGALLAMADALELDRDALRRQARQYSQGMAQKLGLAATLLCDKAAYVFDEPAGGLDPRARALLRAQLARLKQAGRTVLFSSHELADVEATCDRIAILHQGRVRFYGTPQDCRARYDAPLLEQAFLRCID